jgi:hypothetical protein
MASSYFSSNKNFGSDPSAGKESDFFKPLKQDLIAFCCVP